MTTAKNSSIAPIAFAEGASTAVSMGALLVMEHHPRLIAPARDFVARHFIGPSLQRKHPADSPDTIAKAAQQRASLLVKGAGMIAAGFIAHIPLQLAVEGSFHPSEVKQAVFGKTVGVAGSLGCIMLIDQLAPNALPALQKAIYPLVKPMLPKDHRGRETRGAEEIAKLLILDIPSSIAAGLLNYQMMRRGR
jgi:hypothetical protein